ncbi:MAG TPA: hypothetical protein VFF73_23845 [Planctomycetota bacterium]|nr:hypothetical protein [Planctomycetota bacterium]
MSKYLRAIPLAVALLVGSSQAVFADDRLPVGPGRLLYNDTQDQQTEPPRKIKKVKKIVKKVPKKTPLEKRPKLKKPHKRVKKAKPPVGIGPGMGR